MTETNLLHILLVDDDEVDVMNVQRAFKKNNIINPLYTAGNGLEALTLLRGDGTTPPIPSTRRLILLDLNMPKMNGLEFLRTLREDPELRALTVVVLTTSDDDRDKSKRTSSMSQGTFSSQSHSRHLSRRWQH